MSALFKPCVGLTTYFTSVGWCGVMWAPIGPFSMTFRGQPTSSSSLYPIRTNLGPIHRSDEIIRHGIRCSMMCIYFRRGDTTLSSTTTISLLTIRHVAYDIVLWWIFFWSGENTGCSVSSPIFTDLTCKMRYLMLGAVQMIAQKKLFH